MKSIHIVLCLTKWNRDIFETSQGGLGYDFNKNTKDRNENDTWSKIRQNEKKSLNCNMVHLSVVIMSNGLKAWGSTENR